MLKFIINIAYIILITSAISLNAQTRSELEKKHKKTQEEIKYNKITVNSDVSFPFKIPEKYKRIE